MQLASEEVIITLVAGTVLLLFLVAVVVAAAARYQHRKRIHLMDLERAKHETLREILKARLEAQDETLDHVGRELHDNIGQMLSSAKMLVAVVQRTVPAPNETLDVIEETLARAIADLRALSKSLNREWLQKFSLIENLTAEANRVNATNSLTMTLNHADEIDLPAEHQLVLFRIVQESFQNALKHAEPTRIDIDVRQQDGMLEVQIKDDGKGFDTSDLSTQGVGMLNIKNRSQLLGGRAQWTSFATGTSVVIQIPTQQ